MLEIVDAESIVAVLALFVALSQVFSSRRHNKLSVRPHVYDWLSSDSAELRCSFSLANKGLGPAIISKANYYLDGRSVGFREFLRVVDRMPEQFVIRVHDLKKGGAIGKDEVHDVLVIEWDRLKFDLPDSIVQKRRVSEDLAGYAREVSRRLGVEVEYTSLYGERGCLRSVPHTEKV